MSSIVPKTNRADGLKENVALFRFNDPADSAETAFNACFFIYD